MTDEMTDTQVAAQVASRNCASRLPRRSCLPAACAPTNTAAGFAGSLTPSTRFLTSTMCNLANLDAVLHGWLLELVEARLHAVGGGPTLDDADAVAFLAKFQPMIDMALKRMQH